MNDSGTGILRFCWRSEAKLQRLCIAWRGTSCWRPVPGFLVRPCSFPPSRGEENGASSGGKWEDLGLPTVATKDERSPVLATCAARPPTHCRGKQTLAWRSQVQRERSAATEHPSPRLKPIHRAFITRPSWPPGRREKQTCKQQSPRCCLDSSLPPRVG